MEGGEKKMCRIVNTTYMVCSIAILVERVSSHELLEVGHPKKKKAFSFSALGRGPKEVCTINVTYYYFSRYKKKNNQHTPGGVRPPWSELGCFCLRPPFWTFCLHYQQPLDFYF